MSPETLSAIGGVALSLAFAYIPGLKDKFAALDPVSKRGVMGCFLAMIALGIFLLGCLEVPLLGVTCDKGGAETLVRCLVAALIANQSMYPLLPASSKAKKKKRAAA